MLMGIITTDGLHNMAEALLRSRHRDDLALGRAGSGV
jgi:hypothetical protein